MRSNVTHHVRQVAEDVKDAKEEMPGWLELAAGELARSFGIPHGAGVGMAVGLMVAWRKIRGKKKEKVK